MSKQKRVFDEAIRGLESTGGDFVEEAEMSITPRIVAMDCTRAANRIRLAIRCLKILEGAGIYDEDLKSGAFLNYDASEKLAALLLKARRDAEKQPKQVNK